MGLQLKWIITGRCWLIISNNIFDDHLLPSHCYLHSEAVCYLPLGYVLMNKIHPSKNIKLIAARESISRMSKYNEMTAFFHKSDILGFCFIIFTIPNVSYGYLGIHWTVVVDMYQTFFVPAMAMFYNSSKLEMLNQNRPQQDTRHCVNINHWKVEWIINKGTVYCWW